MSSSKCFFWRRIQSKYRLFCSRFIAFIFDLSFLSVFLQKKKVYLKEYTVDLNFALIWTKVNFSMDFLHTFTVILPSVTWTLNNFCFPLDYHLPIMRCGQTISSTAESQCVTHFKVSLRRKHKGTSKIHEITQYTPHKLYRLSIEFHEVPTDALLRYKILLQFTNPSSRLFDCI